MPFENVERDPELDYLADGITESLIRQLAQLPQLQVIARTTVFRFKGQASHADKVGRRLGVGSVLVGRASQRNGRLLIGADLIDVKSGLHLWGEQFDRPASDVVHIQQEISRAIHHKLRMRVRGDLQERVNNWGTDAIEAYHLYLKGRHFTNRFFGDGFRRGIEYFSKAIDQDPTYALAHAGLADCFGYLGFYGYIPPSEVWPKARAAAAKALEIDPSLAEGYASLGLVNLFYDWNPEAGLAKCQHATQLNQSYPPAYTHAAGCLIAMGRREAAAAIMEKAQMLDPLSVWVHTVAGLISYLGRDYERAALELQKALELDAQAGEARRALGITYLQMNDASRALVELEAARRLLGDTPPALGSLGRAYARVGLTDKAESILSLLKSAGEQKRVAAASTAAVYVGLGRDDLALDWLEKAVANRSSWLVWLDVEPWWDPLRQDPRFQRIRERIKARTKEDRPRGAEVAELKAK
jgi:serine/threonine-protein kinase